MSDHVIKGIKIVGMAASVPKKKITHDDFVLEFGETAVSKFAKSTGIKSIHRAEANQTASDLAYEAADYLLRSFGIDRSSIGVLVFVTQSPDYRRPASACVLQSRLGLERDCAALDVGLGCSGFVYGQQVAASMLSSSVSEYALLLIGETASKLVNPKDKSIAMMYGDAGAAILYQKTESEEIITSLYSDGYRFKSIILPAGGFRDMNPTHQEYLCRDGIVRTKYDIYMDGLSVFTFSTSDVPKSIIGYLQRNNQNAKDFDYIVLHQANQFIIKQIMKRIKADNNKVPMSLDRYGNTGGISIPLTLCDTFGGSNDTDDKLILGVGFGIGLSWGIASFRVRPCEILPIIETDNYYRDGIINPEEI